MEILSIKVAHVAAIVALPFHHKDPFDRLLVAQALTEKIPIISVMQCYTIMQSLVIGKYDNLRSVAVGSPNLVA